MTISQLLASGAPPASAFRKPGVGVLILGYPHVPAPAFTEGQAHWPWGTLVDETSGATSPMGTWSAEADEPGWEVVTT